MFFNLLNVSNFFNTSRFLKSFFVGFLNVCLGFVSSFLLNNSLIFLTIIIFVFKLLLNANTDIFFFSLSIVFFNILNVFMSKFSYFDEIVFHLFYVTNLDLFLFLNLFFVSSYAALSLYNSTIIPSSSQSKFEFLYNFIAQTGFAHNGWKGQRHFVFFIVLFLFILVSNFLGMVPFSFTVTSHIFQTFALGCGVISSITILAISKNGLSWFKFFFS